MPLSCGLVSVSIPHFFKAHGRSEPDHLPGSPSSSCWCPEQQLGDATEGVETPLSPVVPLSLSLDAWEGHVHDHRQLPPSGVLTA